MLSVIKQLVLTINLIFIVVVGASANIIDATKNSEVNIKIEIGKYSVIELPFEATSYKLTKKKVVEKIINSNNNSNNNSSLEVINLAADIEKNDTNLLEGPQDPIVLKGSLKPLPDLIKSTDNKKGQPQNHVQTSKETPDNNLVGASTSNKEDKSVSVKGNTIIIIPKESITYDFVVFGKQAKPLLITVHSSAESNNTSRYTKIVDYSIAATNANNTDLSATNASSMVSKNNEAYINYFRYLYVDKNPEGFSEENTQEVLDLYDGRLTATLIKHYVSQTEELKEYILTSRIPFDYYINEDVFTTDNTIGISFDTQDNIVRNGESLRFFVINRL